MPRVLNWVDVAYLGIGIGAAYLLQAQDLIFMTLVCLANHGLAALLRRIQWSHEKIRKVLGCLCYSSALVVLSLQSEVSRRIPLAWSAASDDASATDAQQQVKRLSVLISLAFMVFDHIYAIFFFCELVPSDLPLQISENLVSTSVFLACLASSGVPEDGQDRLCKRWHVYVWLVYKVLRPVASWCVGRQPSFADPWSAATNALDHDNGRVARPPSDSSLAIYPTKSKRKASDDASLSSAASSSTSSSSTSPPKSPDPLLLSDKIMLTSIAKAETAAANPEMLWLIHGKSYDLAEFVDRHPGGREALLLGRGRDCTALFESYHPFTALQVKNVLEKYQVAAGSKSCLGGTEDFFYNLLCERVVPVLKAKGIDPIRDRAASPTRVAYYACIVTAVGVSAYWHVQGSILGSFLFAAFGWLLGALGHDAGHFAASRIPLVNDVCVWGMSLLCNPIMWQHQHTYAHHSFTNDFDHDPDLHHFDNLLRVHRRVRHSPIFGNQTNPLFVIFAYSFVVFGTCFWIPIGMLREGSLYGVVEWTDRKRHWRSAAMFLHIAGYAALVMILPFWRMAWYSALAAAILHLTTSGLLFAFFSQINHLNEPSLIGDELAPSDRDKRLRNSWAVEQVETSNNFCTNSFFWHIFSNGLNLQIEHHLFPGLNHGHLHHIAPVVEKTCKEYGVRYKHFRGWGEIFQATLAWLDKLADDEERGST